jgi:SPP1 gp7 family putative phage head morphogenesis protein
MADRLATILAGYAPQAREAARSTLAGLISTSFTAGVNPLVTAREISRQFAGLTYTRAATIARTEMAVAGWEGTQRDYARDPVVNAWQWMATFDGNACEICTTMHGTEYPTSQRLESHPNCRCTMVPVTDAFRPIGAGETGIEQMRAMNYPALAQIWGPTRARLIAGGVNPRSLIGSRRHPVFGRQPVLNRLTSNNYATARRAAARFEAEVATNARRAIARAASSEPAITSTLQGIAGRTGSTLEGLKYRLKGFDSLTRKIADDMLAAPHLSTAQATDRVLDTVRYTLQFTNETTYASQTMRAMSAMNRAGYETVRLRNYWAGDRGYVGVQAVFRAPNGQLFEVQFHTARSLAAKEPGHVMYEAWRVLPKGHPQRRVLERQMAELWEPIRQTAPRGLNSIEGFDLLGY